MKNSENKKILDENLEKFKYRVNYKINESPQYRPLVDAMDEFDELPLSEVGDQEDAPKPEGEVPKEPDTEKPVGADTPVPGFEDNPEGAETDTMVPPPEGEPTAPPVGVEPTTPPVDDIQNEIIKHNIEAMKSIHDQLENLSNITQMLNTKMDELNADVEEVREPTNTEKLMSKKDVSYPYYFNLNDFWKDNWFSEKYNDGNEIEKGIKELPDGTYIADFDDLPQKSNIDIQNSFNEI